MQKKTMSIVGFSLLITVLITCSYVGLRSLTSNASPPQTQILSLPNTSEYTDAPVEITNDAALSALGLAGSGTVNDPYILEDLRIADTRWSSNIPNNAWAVYTAGIVINHTRQYLLIRNVSVFSESNAIIFNNVSHVYLDNCSAFAEERAGTGMLTGEVFQVNTFRTFRITDSTDIRITNSYWCNLNDAHYTDKFDQEFTNTTITCINNTFDHIAYSDYSLTAMRFAVIIYTENPNTALTFHNNTFYVSHHGISVENGTNNFNCTNNTFYNRWAIYLKGDTHRYGNVSGNMFYNNDNGITYTSDAYENTISENWFYRDECLPITFTSPTWQSLNYLYNNHHRPKEFLVSGNLTVIDGLPYYHLNWSASEYADRYYLYCNNGTNITLPVSTTECDVLLISNAHFTFDITAESVLGMRKSNMLVYDLAYYMSALSLNIRENGDYYYGTIRPTKFYWFNVADPQFITYQIYVNGTATDPDLYDDLGYSDEIGGMLTFPDMGWYNLTLIATHLPTGNTTSSTRIIQLGELALAYGNIIPHWNTTDGHYTITLQCPPRTVELESTSIQIYILIGDTWEKIYEESPLSDYDIVYTGQVYESGNYRFKIITHNKIGDLISETPLDDAIYIPADNATPPPNPIGIIIGSIGGAGIVSIVGYMLMRARKTKLNCTAGETWSFRKKQCTGKMSPSKEPHL